MFADLIIIGLACWRISSMVVGEEGPWFVFDNIRRLVKAGDYNDLPEPDRRWFIGIFECVWCCSMWVGIAYAAIYYISPEFSVLCAVPFAISAISIVVHHMIGALQSGG